MKNEQLVGLGVRLFAIWLVVYTVRSLPTLWLFGTGQDGSGVFVFAIAYLLLLIVSAILLWLFPLTVANKLLPGKVLDVRTALPLEELQCAAFCLLGLWLLTDAIPSLTYYFVLFYQFSKDYQILHNPQTASGLMRSVVELIIGVWLLFGARGLLGLLRWARHAGKKITER